MHCDCSKLDYGALLVLPLECKTILGPFDRDWVLVDVLFDLYNHPNGAASKACGFVWNVLPTNWSRLLFGGTVDDRGRQYHLESGVLCPKDSYLDICSCYFVNEPTALFSARVMGCYCENPPRLSFEAGPLLTIDWNDIGVENALDPLDPTGQLSRDRRQMQVVRREVLASASEAVEAGELRIKGADREVCLQAGSAVAFRVNRSEWRWSCEGMRAGSGRGPKDTNLVVARRSADGRLLHWVMYRETQPEAPKRAQKKLK
jgi:hypothetical protein